MFRKFTPYTVTELPATGIDVDGLYLVKPNASAKFTLYIRKMDNSDWIALASGVESVNGISNPDVQLDLSLSSTGVLSITGGTATINLDDRYTKITDDIAWSRVTGVPSFAMDSEVLHKSGNETKAGILTFSSSPVVPAASAPNHAVNKGQMDTADAALQAQVNNLSAAVTDGMRVPVDLDCSTNPNYPASTKGDGYVVTAPGKIGGPAGIEVRRGAEIRCKTTSPAGTHASVGSNFYILESDLDQATETVPGFAKIATQALADAGTNDTDIVTPKKLQKRLNDANTASDGKYVRYDAAQSLTSAQKATARGNIGAADDATVVKTSGNQTVAGVKTFGATPVLPLAAPTANEQASNKKYVDDTVAAAVAWGGRAW